MGRRARAPGRGRRGRAGRGGSRSRQRAVRLRCTGRRGERDHAGPARCAGTGSLRVRRASSQAMRSNNEQPDGTFSPSRAPAGGLGFRGSFTGRTSDDVRTPAGELFNSGGQYPQRQRERRLSGWLGLGRGRRTPAGTSGSRSTKTQPKILDRHPIPAHRRRPGTVSGSLPRGRLAPGPARWATSGTGGASSRTSDATDVALGLLSTHLQRRCSAAPSVRSGGMAGIVGVAGLRNEFDKFGEETLIPNNAYNNLGVYAFEQLETRPLELCAGRPLRLSPPRVEDDADLGVVAQRAHLQLRHRQRRRAVPGGGARWRMVLNVGRGYRSPTAFDLFSNGVHEGTVRFERGDSTLRERDLHQHRPGAQVQGQERHRSRSAASPTSSTISSSPIRQARSIPGPGFRSST